MLRIANRLQAFEDYVSGTLPIPAHGDDFSLFGTAPNNEGIAHALDRLRVEIEGIRIGTRQGEMSCTLIPHPAHALSPAKSVLLHSLLRRHDTQHHERLVLVRAELGLGNDGHAFGVLGLVQLAQTLDVREQP